MPFTQQNPFSFNHIDQIDTPLDDATTLKQLWDSRGNELRTAFNGLIAALNATAASASVGFSPNANVDTEANTVQEAFDALVNLLHGTGGAAWLKSVGVSGITGDNVQALLESLKSYIDTHKDSSDHDERYYTESEIDTKISTLNNADSDNATNLTDHKTSGDHDSRYYTETESDAKFETKDDITNNRKLSADGNFTGKLNGYPIVQADPGYSSMVAGMNDTLNAHLADNAAHATINDITYYINSSTGNDNNNGLSSGTAFKTIMKAINLIPQKVNHTVTINVASGTYSEDVLIRGFVGKGTIKLYGGTDLATAVNYIVNLIEIRNCTLTVDVKGFIATTTTTIPFVISNCIRVTASYLVTTVSATTLDGFYVVYSGASLTACKASNRAKAVSVGTNTNIMVATWDSGSGNTVGLYAEFGGEIIKVNTQPSGTTAEVTSYGGVIK
jgi:hypothetical protein